MLKIKLDRIGRKGQPQYHVVVVEDKTNSGTRPVAQIGYYNPLSPTKEFRLDVKSYETWITKGAIPTETVASLARRNSKATKVEAKTTVKPVKAPKTAK
ncbi:MAG: 30S ribosomal protein S16 [bacterium]